MEEEMDTGDAKGMAQHHHEHVISIQIGHETNKLMSYLWTMRELDVTDDEGTIWYESGYHLTNQKEHLIPKCVMIDNQPNELNADENEVDLEKVLQHAPWQGPSEVRHLAQRAKARGNSAWFQKTKFNQKSFVKFPAIDEAENSQWYYQRKVNNGMKKSTEEIELIALDNIRYFAEASDRVDSIDIYADIYGDLGSVNANILEKLRDDYGTNISIPIWLIDHHRLTNCYPINFRRLAPQKTLKLFHHSLVLNYASLLDYSSIIIPLQIPVEESVPSPAPSANIDAQLFQYRLTGSIALETCLSYRCNNSQQFNSNAHHVPSSKEWIHFTTSGKRLPICFMEGFLPAITHDYHQANEQYILNSLETLKTDSLLRVHHQSSSSNNSSSRSKIPPASPSRDEYFYDATLFHFNPFMTSFGLTSYNNLRKNAPNNMERYERPLTNSLLFRGFGSPELTEKIFMECVGSPYLVSRCDYFNQGLRVKWEVNTKNETSYMSDTFFSGVGVGSNAMIGEHLREETQHWYETTLESMVQYQKVDLGREDLEQKKESLLQLSENYA